MYLIKKIKQLGNKKKVLVCGPPQNTNERTETFFDQMFYYFFFIKVSEKCFVSLVNKGYFVQKGI